MGIIVANGWIQDGGSEEAFTVISRDGGVSWNALTHDVRNRRFNLICTCSAETQPHCRGRNLRPLTTTGFWITAR